ncbi:MAG: sigma-54-dependent transcriptional regulator [Paenirhodobacter sp.]|uniref:sigma-54-dependent transcriptional regulator n=1 Tax=Paenirhodobacter sp. TaxID=1965326 RepID=UPI003D152566
MTLATPIPPPPPRPDILLIEDTSSMRAIYEAHLRRAGFTTVSAASAAEGLALFRQHEAPVVLLDLMLPDRDGIELMSDFFALRPATAVIVLTADRSIDRAVTAMRAGAQDFLVKPVSEHRLMSAIENAFAAVNLTPAGDGAEPAGPLGAFIGGSPAMRAVYARIRAAARSMAPVCIMGESGSGKELCAQAVHQLSLRGCGPFITFDCGAIPSERLDSELFGHRRGAFPGALGDRPGAAERAEGGTLFLDEICELDPALQPKLLRFLQDGAIQPLGADRPQRVDVRIIAASTMPPLEAVRAGRLREDLYYRLVVVPITMPPLRARREDILPIAEDLLRRYAALEGRSFERIAPEAQAVLCAQDWPGNVRELMNVLRAAVVMHDGVALEAGMLPLDGHSGPPEAEPAAPPPGTGTPRSLAQIEREAIEAALARHGGSVPRAARDLDVAPSTLYRKLDSWRKD